MSKTFNTDTVERHIEASPEVLYDLIADVTRMPEFSPYIARVKWIGTPGPRVGAKFKAHNKMGRGPVWFNYPVVTVVEPNREFAFERTEPFAGTIEWRYKFVPEGTGTRVIESYRMVKPVKRLGWFIIEGLYGVKDIVATHRAGMEQTLAAIDKAVTAGSQAQHP